MKLNHLLFVVITILAFPTLQAAPIPFEGGKLYEIGSDRSKVLFKFRVENKWESDFQVVRTRFMEPDGKLASTEHLILTKEGTLQKYEFKQYQINESGVVEVKDGKIHFSYLGQDGEKETATEDYVDNFVIGPMIVKYVRDRWKGVLAGETFKIRMGVPDRQETVGFKFFKMDEFQSPDGKTMVRVKLKPSSFIIAALVDPIILTFEKQEGTFHSVLGRTMLKRKTGNGWTELDADAVFMKEI